MNVGILFGGMGRRMKYDKDHPDGCPKWQLPVGDKLAYELLLGEIMPLEPSSILMVVPEGMPPVDGVTQIQSSQGYLPDLGALIRAAGDEQTLIVHGDAMVATTDDLSAFVRSAARSRAHLVLPIVPKAALPVEKQGALRTNYMQGTLGWLPGHGLARGQVMFLSRPLFPDQALLKRMERNKIYGAGKLLGADNIWRILTLQMRPHHWEERFQLLFGGSVELLECNLANLAIDIDDRDDYQFLLATIEQRRERWSRHSLGY